MGSAHGAARRQSRLDAGTDPGFNLGPTDNLVLLAPGPTPAFGDDVGIAFVANGTAVTPASFGRAHLTACCLCPIERCLRVTSKHISHIHERTLTSIQSYIILTLAGKATVCDLKE